MYGTTPPSEMMTLPSNLLNLEERLKQNAVSRCDALFVITNSQLEMSWVDATLLVIAGSVAGELEDFGSEIFEHGSKIYCKMRSQRMKRGKKWRATWGTTADTAAKGRVSQEAVDAADGELQASPVRARLACCVLAFAAELATRAPCTNFCGHVDIVDETRPRVDAVFVPTRRVMTRQGQTNTNHYVTGILGAARVNMDTHPTPTSSSAPSSSWPPNPPPLPAEKHPRLEPRPSSPPKP